jgi:hypothetical protein
MIHEPGLQGHGIYRGFSLEPRFCPRNCDSKVFYAPSPTRESQKINGLRWSDPDGSAAGSTNKGDKRQNGLYVTRISSPVSRHPPPGRALRPSPKQLKVNVCAVDALSGVRRRRRLHASQERSQAACC